MCNSCIEWISSHTLRPSMQKSRSKRSRIRVHGLNRRRISNIEKDVDMDMELKLRNLKLYMENMSILDRNDELRKKAMLLHQENLVLMSQLQNKVSQQLP